MILKTIRHLAILSDSYRFKHKSSKWTLSCIALLIFLSFHSCVEEFDSQINTYEELLVVDGFITDQKGPYSIQLSKSSGVREFTPLIPYTGCRIEIMDDQGGREVLTEFSGGMYQTSPTGIQGVSGRRYKILIATPNGELYESKEELLRPGIGIKSVYAEYEHRNNPQLFFGQDGYQFYLDTEVPSTNDNFFYWRLESTYKFKLEFGIQSYYDGVLKPFPYQDSLRTCYRTVKKLDIFTFNSSIQNQLPLMRVPLHYEDNYTKALQIRYSVKVSQFTINEAAYTYWNSIKKIYESQGELYSQQPFQVKSNIVNIHDPQKPALGYFMAAGLSEKRIFVDPLWVKYRYPVCKLIYPDNYLIKTLASTTPDLWPIYITGGQWLPKECVDCRETGFLKKPDFWID